MEGLFNPVSILLHVVNAAILFVAVYFLLYKPVRKFMAVREAKVAGALEEADKMREQADQAVRDSKNAAANAMTEAEASLTEKQNQALLQEKKILDAAHQQADTIVSRARQEADTILKNARQEMREQAADLAVEIAKSILERDVSRADHEKLIEETIRKVG